MYNSKSEFMEVLMKAFDFSGLTVGDKLTRVSGDSISEAVVVRFEDENQTVVVEFLFDTYRTGEFSSATGMDKLGNGFGFILNITHEDGKEFRQRLTWFLHGYMAGKTETDPQLLLELQTSAAELARFL